MPPIALVHQGSFFDRDNDCLSTCYGELVVAANKNQHFIPQYYFRFFNEGGDHISLLLRHDGRTIGRAPIRGQSSKSYFYGDADVEKKVTEIESKFIAPLRRIRALKNLSTLSREDHELLVQAVVFQRTRTVASRIDNQPMADHLFRLQVEVDINTNSDLTEEEREELRGLLPKLSMGAEAFQGMLMALSVQHAHSLLDLDVVLVKNKTARPFIFGDAPVVFTNPAQKKITYRGVLGTKSPGLIAYYPIGPFEAIMLIDPVMYNVKGVREGLLNVRSLQDVAQLNKLQIHASRFSVYFNDHKYSDYVKYLWADVGAGSVEARGVVKEIKIDDNRELVHNYECQLSFFPVLTFLRFVEVPADSNFVDRAMYFSGQHA